MVKFINKFRSYFIPLIIFIIAVLIRVIILHFFTEHQAARSDFSPFVFPDSANFVEYSRNLLDTGEYIDSSGRLAWRTPGYFLLLSLVIKHLGANIFWWRMLNIVLAGVSCVLAWSTAKRLWGEAAGIISGIILACYPFMAYLDTLVLADTLGVFTVLLATRLLVEAVISGRGAWAVVCGLACAMAALSKASLGGLAILYSSYLLLCWWGRLRFRAFILSGCLLFAFVFGMVPWVMRNNIALKAFVPFSTMGGFTLWECSGPGANGGANNSKVPFPREWYSMMSKLQQGERISPDGKDYEVLADNFLKDKCLEIILDDPVRFIGLSWHKFRRTWSPVPNWSGASGWKFALVMAGFYVPVMFLAFAGVWIMRKSWREVYCLLLPAVYLAVVHSIFMGSIRYRLPAVAVLSVLAAGVVTYLLFMVYDSRRQKQ